MQPSLLLLFCPSSPATLRADLHVDAKALSLLSDGSLSRPFHSLSKAAEHIIWYPHPKGTRRTVWIRPGTYSPLCLDHIALSGVSWRGMPEAAKPVVSGGIEVPRDRFKRWASGDGAYVTSIDGLGADDLGGMKNSITALSTATTTRWT